MTPELIYITWLISMVSTAVLGCWIAYSSTLFQEIKRFLYLLNDQKLPKFKFWFKPIGWLFKEFRELINCPFCLSYHLSWLTSYLVYDFSLIQSIILGGITVFFVDVYRKITLS